MIFTTFNGFANEKYFNDNSINTINYQFKNIYSNFNNYFKQEEGSEQFVFIKK